MQLLPAVGVLVAAAVLAQVQPRGAFAQPAEAQAEAQAELPLALERAWQASRVQRWQACLKFAKQSLAADGPSALGLYLKGAALLRLDQASNALDVLRRALSEPQGAFPAPRALLLSDVTQAAVVLRKFDLARGALSALAEVDPPLASLAALTALSHIDPASEEDFANHLQSVVERHGDDDQRALAASLRAPEQVASNELPRPLSGGPSNREATSEAGVVARRSLPAAEDSANDGSRYFTFMTTVAAGYDSNVEQTPNTGLLQIERDVFGAPKGGYFGTAAATLGLGRSNKQGSWDLGYTFFQLAYQDPRYEALALQEHIAELQLRKTLGRGWWAQTLIGSDASFSGLRDSYELFQVAPNAHVAIGAAYGAGWQSQVTVDGAHRKVMDQAFDFLQGQRLAVTLAQGLRRGGWQMRLSLRARREFLGQRLQAQDVRGDDEDPYPTFKACPTCTDVAALTDYGFDAIGPFLWLSSPRTRWASAMLVLSAERRVYGESGLLGRNDDGRLERHNVWRRQDDRGAANLFVAAQPLRALRVGIRYGFSFNLSNVQGQHFNKCAQFETLCHPMHFQSRSFMKHMVSLELELTL